MVMRTYYGRYKGAGRTWHPVRANSSLEATAKMLKGTKYIFSEVVIKTTNPSLRKK
jgi:hypothetical protein